MTKGPLAVNIETGKRQTKFNCVKCMHCINVMPGALAPGRDRGATILIGGKRSPKIGDMLASVLVPFMGLRSDEDRGRLTDLVRRIWAFWSEHALDKERVGEFIDRIGLGAFLAGIGVAPDPRMVRHPRANSYIKFDELAPPRLAGEPQQAPGVVDRDESAEAVAGEGRAAG